MEKIYTQKFKTEVGELIVGSYDNMICIVDFANRKNRSTIDRRLQRALGTDYIEKASPIIRVAKKQIDEYLARKRENFDLPIMTLGTEFQKSVWVELKKIPYGETTSYREIAKRIKKPRAIRAVANAINANALGIIIPCHRVISSDGTLGGYAGGTRAKKALFQIENISK